MALYRDYIECRAVILTTDLLAAVGVIVVAVAVAAAVVCRCLSGSSRRNSSHSGRSMIVILLQDIIGP